MAFSVLPHWTGGSIFDIDPAALARRGITLLLADLDNTLVPYGVPEPTEAVRAWNRALEEAGVTLFVLSNNRHPQRAERFAHALGVPFLGHAGKPSPRGLEAAMARAGTDRTHTAMLGDKLLTDMLAANRAGVLPLMVEPVGGAVTAWQKVLHALQAPFKADCRRKMEKKS